MPSCIPKRKYIIDEGIQREYLISVDKMLADSNKYDYTSNECNFDNIIYLPNKEFKYSAKYIKAGDTLYIAFEGGNWRLHKKETETCIERIGIEIENGNFEGMTISKYNYYLYKGVTTDFEKAGIIENPKNIWIHPPRSSLFRILELNPFPYIKSPFRIGNKWEWKLDISDYYSSSAWKSWRGLITNNYQYEIVDKTKLSTEFGILDVTVIKGLAKSRIGQTQLVSYFNELYGFVRLDYLNIDNSEIILELKEIELN